MRTDWDATTLVASQSTKLLSQIKHFRALGHQLLRFTVTESQSAKSKKSQIKGAQNQCNLPELMLGSGDLHCINRHVTLSLGRSQPALGRKDAIIIESLS